MKEKITVVVPVYNVSEYLKKCINSIINQTYQNLEIILVDDGSTDNSGLICDEFAKKNKKIKVIHKENGGLSDARNVAIDIAEGKYITFIDSDDFVDLDMIEFLYNSLKNNNADISTCSFQQFNDCKNIIKDSSNNEVVYSNTKALEKLLYQDGCTTSAWGKLYKTTLFKNIRYPKGKICEDLDTTYLLFSKSNKIVINTAKKYFYLQRSSSIINSKFNIKRMDALEFAKKETNYIKKNHPDLLNAAINREFMEAVFILSSMNNVKDNIIYFKKLNNTIKNTRKTVLTDKKSRKLYRLYALISYLGTKTLFYAIKIKIFLKRW